MSRSIGIVSLDATNFLMGPNVQITNATSLEKRDGSQQSLSSIVPQKLVDSVSDTIKITYTLPSIQHKTDPGIEPGDLIFHIRPIFWKEKQDDRMLAFSTYTLQEFLEAQYDRALKLAAGVENWSTIEVTKNNQMQTGIRIITGKLEAVKKGEIAMDTGRSDVGMEIDDDHKCYFFADPVFVREIVQFSGVRISPPELKELYGRESKKTKYDARDDNWLLAPKEDYYANYQITAIIRGDFAHTRVPVDGPIRPGDAITCCLEGGISDITPGPVRLRFYASPEFRRLSSTRIVTQTVNGVAKQRQLRFEYTTRPSYCIGYSAIVGSIPYQSSDTLEKTQTRTIEEYQRKSAKLPIKVVIKI